MEINGIPTHPLVVHAVVVLGPLAALSAIILALMPSTRWWSRWATLVGALVSALTMFAARITGDDLIQARPFLTSEQSAVRDTIARHQDFADALLIATVAFAVLAVAAWWVLPADSGLASGRGSNAGRLSVSLRRVIAGLLVVAALGFVVLVVLTGDQGAQAVWASALG